MMTAIEQWNGIEPTPAETRKAVELHAAFVEEIGRPPEDPFFVYVLDHEKRQFTVDGPTLDETPWLEEWKNGPLNDRELAVVPYVGLNGRSMRSKIAQEIFQQFRYEERPGGSILKGGNPR